MSLIWFSSVNLLVDVFALILVLPKLKWWVFIKLLSLAIFMVVLNALSIKFVYSTLNNAFCIMVFIML